MATNDKSSLAWIISERKNGLGLSVMRHGATYRQSPDRNYYRAVDAEWRTQALMLAEALEEAATKSGDQQWGDAELICDEALQEFNKWKAEGE